MPVQFADISTTILGKCHKQKTLPNGAPQHQHRVKDRVCCLFFGLFCFVWFIIGMVAMASGNPSALVFGTDYQGNICGSDNLYLTVDGSIVNNGKGGRNLVSQKRIFFPRVTEDVFESSQVGFDPQNPIPTIDTLHLTGVCVVGCPKKGEYGCMYEAEDALAAMQGTTPPVLEPKRSQLIASCKKGNPAPECQMIRDGCFMTAVTTTSSFYRCLPSYDVTKVITQDCIDPGPLPPNMMAAHCNTIKESTQVVTLKSASANFIMDKFDTTKGFMTKHLSDIQKAKTPIMMTGILFSVFAALIICILFKWMPYCTSWLTLVGALLSSVLLTITFYLKGGVISIQSISLGLNYGLALSGQNNSKVEIPVFLAAEHDSQSYYNSTGNLFLIISLALLLLYVAIEPQVNYAVDTISDASKMVAKIPSIIYYPIMTTILMMILALWTIGVGANLASMDNLKVINKLSALIVSDVPKNSSLSAIIPGINNATQFIVSGTSTKNSLGFLGLYHLLGFLWMNAFIHGVGMCTVAGAVASYYWVRNKEDRPSHPLIDALTRTWRYNIGSIAAASFIISVIQFFRMFLEAINRKVRAIKSRNRVIDVLVAIIRTVMLIVEVLLQLVNKNSYIVIGMCGTGYLTSAFEATGLLFHSLTDVAQVNYTAQYVIFCAKLFVMFASAGILIAHLTNNSSYYGFQGDAQLNTQIAPLYATMFLSFFISSGFFYVYDMIYDTLLLCYCYDMVHVKDEHFFSEEYQQRIDLFKIEREKGNNLSKRFKYVTDMAHKAQAVGSALTKGYVSPNKGGRPMADDEDLVEVDLTPIGENLKSSSTVPVTMTYDEVSREAEMSGGTFDIGDDDGFSGASSEGRSSNAEKNQLV